jgi:hypothetical protein
MQMIQSEKEKQRLEDEVEGSRSQQGFSDLRKWHLKNQKQLHPRRKFKNNLAKVKGENANAEAPKINGKDIWMWMAWFLLMGRWSPNLSRMTKSKIIYFKKFYIHFKTMEGFLFFSNV